MFPVRGRYNTWQKVGVDVGLMASRLNSGILTGGPVASREPTVNDSAWPVGALWRGNRWYTCQRTGYPALWQPSNRPGSSTFADAVPSGTASPVGLYGTGAVKAGWTGNLFDLTLADGVTVKTFAVYANGRPNLADIRQFIGTSTGYVTKLYDQSGGTHDATQATVANAPFLDLTRIQNGFPAIVFDFDARIYANAGNTGKVYLDLPVGHSLTLNNHAMFFVGSLPNFPTDGRPMTAGVSGGSALSSSNTFAMLRLGGSGTVSWLRAIANTGGANSQYSYNVPTNSGVYPRHGVHVYGYSRTGTTVRWYSEEYSGSGTSGSDPGSGAITNGSLGNSQQFAAQGNVFGGDLEAYAFATFNADLGATVAANLVQAIWEQFAIAPQTKHTIIFDGTSTTRTTGGSITMSYPRQVADLLAREFTVRAGNFGVGQSAEAMLQIFSTYPGAQFDPTFAKLLVTNPGIGNSLQATGAFTVSSQVSANTLVISTSMLFPSFASVGAIVTVSGGGASVPVGTVISAVNNANNPTQVTLSNPISGGTPTTMTVQNSTGIQVWNTITQYLTLARKTGFKILLVGSASRGTFSGAQATEFRTAKNLMIQQWQGYADAFLDLENDPAFGGVTPWTNATYWQSDTQHYTPLGYSLIASLVANAIQANDLLMM